ncbi:hypothetical protein [Cytobacillus purgationiresistens]|uniref:Uncharacterized protein n=1 Tax=Cytobacillus purgationiresistens TaxID=863449 RepID=A0ABU0AIS8_9BACI|nr:hypothetical protein [Cytobacillus purgationiresistens]MDQ0271169.1 hypothetical protein [Cytobacillus purgationiresistens]
MRVINFEISADKHYLSFKLGDKKERISPYYPSLHATAQHLESLVRKFGVIDELTYWFGIKFDQKHPANPCFALN